MPDTDTTPNPYQPLEETQQGSVECPFEGRVTVADFANSQRGARAFAMLVILPMVLFFIWAGVGALQSGAADSGISLVLAGVVFGFLLWRIWRLPQRMGRTHPHLFGSFEGKLATDFTEIRTETMYHRIRSDCLRIHAVRKEWISVRAGTDLLLMSDLFTDYATACELAAEIHRTAIPLDFGDERLLQPPPSMASEMPDGAISLSGQQTSSDFQISEMASGASKLRWFIVRNSLIALLINIGVLLVTQDFLLATPTLVLSLIWLYKKVIQPVSGSLKAASLVRKEDRPVSLIDGWASESELHFRSAVSQSVYQWSNFERFRMKDEDTLVLIMQGNALLCAINRRLLASDGEWERLMKMVREKFPETT